ncbi:MAG: ABC transporter substrate-binding protein [Planctomycetota bacterium]
MRLIILLCIAFMIVGGLATAWTAPGEEEGSTQLFWVTDLSPVRIEHVDGFTRWQLEQGLIDDQGKPLAKVKVDPNNGDQDKIVIQGVGGVGADIIDTRWGRQVRLFSRVGIIKDITSIAREGGFSVADTWDAIESEIAVDGRQYMYPCNVAVRLFWVNQAVFDKLGLEQPPAVWDFDTFERIGLEFTKRANTNPDRQTHFFFDQLPIENMYRGVGLSIFNETGTASALNNELYAEVLQRHKSWVYDLHLMPSPEDISALQVTSGWGGSSPRLFNEGRLGLLYSGRYILIQFRQFVNDGAEPLQLGVVEPPHGGFRNTRTTVRGAAIYRGGKNQALAEIFPRYLASKLYNQLIIDSADALPPNPKFVQSRSFTHPPDWPNEWGCHQPFVDAMETTAIGGSYSPFILTSDAERIRDRFKAEFDAGLIDAQTAARRTAELIELRIQRNLEEFPETRAEYDSRVATQQKIEERLAAGQPIPESWINNPFFRRYYAAQGLLLKEDGPTGGPSGQGGDP